MPPSFIPRMEVLSAVADTSLTGKSAGTPRARASQARA